MKRKRNDIFDNLSSSEIAIIKYFTTSRSNMIGIIDIATSIGLSIPSVTKKLTKLIEAGLVIDLGKVETSIGRHPNMYGLKSDAAYFLGVDITRKKLNFGIINFSGEIIDLQMGVPYSLENSQDSVNRLSGLIDAYIKNVGINRDKIINVNVSIPGRVNAETGYSYSHLITNQPLVDIIESKLGISVSIENDTRSMTYGEFLRGETEDVKNALYVNLSYGLGMGIVIGGEVYKGKSGFSGEFGHMNVFDNEIICSCGKIGCLETEVSGMAIRRIFVERVKTGSNSILLNKKKLDDITLDDIIQAVKEEDVLCINIVQEIGNQLGRQIANFINVFNPEKVIIGGIISQIGEYFILHVESAVKRLSLNLVNKDSKIELSTLQEKGGVIGSCLISRISPFAKALKLCKDIS